MSNSGAWITIMLKVGNVSPNFLPFQSLIEMNRKRFIKRGNEERFRFVEMKEGEDK